MDPIIREIKVAERAIQFALERVPRTGEELAARNLSMALECLSYARQALEEDQPSG